MTRPHLNMLQYHNYPTPIFNHIKSLENTKNNDYTFCSEECYAINFLF